MFKKIALGTAAALTALTAIPTAAQANHRDGYYGDRYERGYDDRYARRYDERYARGYDDRYYGRDYNRRCSGTTGTIVGGAAGAILGRTVTRDRYRGRSGTTGAILGGALGALAGRSIDKNSCRNRY